MPNRALVMSGGGSKGAFEVGAVDYLVRDRGLDFQVIAGVSTGSLNAVILAQGAGPEGLKAQTAALKDLWFGIHSSRDIYTSRFLGKLLVLLSKNSINSPEPLRKKLEQHVSPQRLLESGRDLRVGAVSLESGDYIGIDQRNPSILDWTLASSSMPVMFPPVSVGGQTAVDGGVRNITPLQDAFAALKARASDGTDEMYVILASPLTILPARGPWKTGIAVAMRSVSILTNEIFRADLEYALAINEAVAFYGQIEQKLTQSLGRTEAARFLSSIPYPFRPPKYRYVRIWTILPPKEYSESLEFDPLKIREAFDGGREAARHALGEREFSGKLESVALAQA